MIAFSSISMENLSSRMLMISLNSRNMRHSGDLGKEKASALHPDSLMLSGSTQRGAAANNIGFQRWCNHLTSNSAWMLHVSLSILKLICNQNWLNCLTCSFSSVFISEPDASVQHCSFNYWSNNFINMVCDRLTLQSHFCVDYQSYKTWKI